MHKLERPQVNGQATTHCVICVYEPVCSVDYYEMWNASGLVIVKNLKKLIHFYTGSRERERDCAEHYGSSVRQSPLLLLFLAARALSKKSKIS